MNRQLWTISNSLSVLRIILVLPLAVFIASDVPGDRVYAIWLIIIGVLTDFFDGFFARKFGQVTDIGKIIDPLADKITGGAVCIILAMKGELPLWFVLAAIARDILILIGGLYVKKKKGILLQSNIIGKWTVGIMTMYVFFTVLRVGAIAWLADVLLVASIVMLVISFVIYAQRFVRTIT